MDNYIDFASSRKDFILCQGWLTDNILEANSLLNDYIFKIIVVYGLASKSPKF